MKALVLEELNRLTFKEVPQPRVSPHEVLVEVKAAGICGSDIHGMGGSTGRRIPPIIMGHEAAGVIVEVGSEVEHWREGDRVTFDSTMFCGECYFCHHGLINLCDGARVPGVSCGEYRQNGAFAEYVAVPQRILYRLPDGLSYEHAALVEPVSVAMHALSRSPVAVNDTAVVVGAGVIGLIVIQLLRAAGCGCIIAVDLDPTRLELARSLGADDALDSASQDVVGSVLRHTDGRGADVAFEAVGISPTVKLAVHSLRKRGKLTLIGNLSPTVDLPLQSVVLRELSLIGTCRSCWDYPACLDIIHRGVVDVDALTSAVAPLADGALWFERLREGEGGLLKVLLAP